MLEKMKNPSNKIDDERIEFSKQKKKKPRIHSEANSEARKMNKYMG